jgi:thioredoxin-related protein
MGFGRIENGGRERGGAHGARRALLRRILACALTAAAAGAGTARAQSRTPHRLNLPPAKDLAADAATSVRDRVPIFLFFDRHDCPYCARALAQIVVPMSNEPRWRDRALYRQVEVDQPLPLVGFDGRATTHAALAERYGVSLTPTVLVVDSAGAAIGKPIVGFLTVDFYAAYLEGAVDAGLAKLRGASLI